MREVRGEGLVVYSNSPSSKDRKLWGLGKDAAQRPKSFPYFTDLSLSFKNTLKNVSDCS